MKSAITASTQMPQPSMKIPVCPVGANAARTPRGGECVAQLEHDRHLADVRVGAHGENDRLVQLADPPGAHRQLLGWFPNVMNRHSKLRGKRTEFGVFADEAVQPIPDLQAMLDGPGQGRAQVVRQAVARYGDADEKRVCPADDAIGHAVHDGDGAAESEDVVGSLAGMATVEDGSDVGCRVPDDRMRGLRRRRAQLVLRVDEVTRHAINQTAADCPAKRCRLAARRTSGIFNSNSPAEETQCAAWSRSRSSCFPPRSRLRTDHRRSRARRSGSGRSTARSSWSGAARWVRRSIPPSSRRRAVPTR